MMSAIRSSLRSLARDVHKRLLPSGEAVSTIGVLDMLAHNWSLGFTSFGGPTVHFQIFRKQFVDDYKWIDETTYQEMFALCQAFSGPGSTKMLFGINILHYGFWVGILSFFVWSLPMAIASLGLAIGIQNIGDQLPGPVYALLSGLNSATVGIVALAAVQLSTKAITDTLTRILVFLGATAGLLYNALWYFPVLMIGGGIVTIVYDLKLLQRTWKSLRTIGDSHDMPREEGFDGHQSVPISRLASASTTALDEGTAVQTQRPHFDVASNGRDPPTNMASTESRSTLTGSWKIGVAILGAFFASFIIIMVCRGLYNGASRGFDLFANLFLAGTIIFGGGPVVIPLLREYVVTPGWVSPRDFVLGLAITQAFPGPNFNFAVYLGALAVRGSSIPVAIGALIAYLGIFLPGLWLFAGSLGLWARMRKVQAVRACLRGVHATAVGLVFTAVYRIFEIGYLDETLQNGASLSRDPWWVVIVATSFVGGMHFKVSPPVAIVLGAIMGLVWYAVVRV